MNMKAPNAHYKNFKKLKHLNSGKLQTLPLRFLRKNKRTAIALSTYDPNWKNKKKGMLSLRQHEENRAQIQRRKLSQHSSNFCRSWYLVAQG